MCFENSTSFTQTVHPNNFEIKCFLLNACLFSRLFQTDNVENKVWDNGTKSEMARVKQQAFIFRVAGVHSSFERREILPFNI